MGLLLVIILLWLVPNALVANYARSKGHSFWGYFVLGLLVSWIISWLIALIVRPNTARLARASAATGGELSQRQPADKLDQLRKLADLRKDGVLTEEEFSAEKDRLLS